MKTYSQTAHILITRGMLPRSRRVPHSKTTQNVQRRLWFGYKQLLLVGLVAVAMLPSVTLAQAPATPGVFVVNTVADDPDTTADGVCRTLAGACSLRAAIQEANAYRGSNEIRFNIPGNGVQTIRLNSSLPAMVDASGSTTIDGYSQTGASPNSDPQISNAKILIEVIGNGVGSFTGEGAFHGFVISSPNNVIKGVALYNLFRPILITELPAKNNRITGNFIGTNAAGTYATAPRISKSDGVIIQRGASGNHVGGVLPQDRNVVSGNAWRGIQLIDQGTINNDVKGNIIGLGPTGNILGVTPSGETLGNGLHNVDLQLGATDNIIGGLEAGARNIISVAAEVGVEVSHSSATQRNIVVGNCIGTGVDCQSPRPNGTFGVRVKDGVTGTVVSSNLIAHNAQGGVDVAWRSDYQPTADTLVKNNTIINNGNFGVYAARAHRLKVESNSITQNGAHGVLIDEALRDGNSVVTITANTMAGHQGLGIERNVPLGPNTAELPVLTIATPQRVTGYTCPSCSVEVFQAAPDAGETYGEGATLLGAGVADGNGWFDIPVSNLGVGQYVTATRTTPTGETSEFSQNRLVAQRELAVFIPQATR